MHIIYTVRARTVINKSSSNIRLKCHLLTINFSFGTISNFLSIPTALFVDPPGLHSKHLKKQCYSPSILLHLGLAKNQQYLEADAGKNLV